MKNCFVEWIEPFGSWKFIIQCSMFILYEIHKFWTHESKYSKYFFSFTQILSKKKFEIKNNFGNWVAVIPEGFFHIDARQFQINYISRHLIPRIFFSIIFIAFLGFPLFSGSTIFWYQLTALWYINQSLEPLNVSHSSQFEYHLMYKTIIFFFALLFWCEVQKNVRKDLLWIALSVGGFRRNKYFNYAKSTNPNDVPCDNKFSRFFLKAVLKH